MHYTFTIRLHRSLLLFIDGKQTERSESADLHNQSIEESRSRYNRGHVIFTTKVLIGVLLRAGVVNRFDVVVRPGQRPRV